MERRERVSPRGRVDPFAIGLLVCVAAFAIFALADFGRLFLLIEYRQWATPINAAPLDIERTRTLGYATAGFLTILFGHVPWLHNLVHIALIAGSGAFLAATLRRLFPDAPWMLAVGAAAFFLFAEPTLDALSWQATILDKLAAFFTALGLYAASVIEIDRDDGASIGAANLVMLVIVFCAYNAKEAAWSLLPSAFALLALRLVDRDGTSLRAVARATVRTAIRFAAPVLYVIYHLIVVLRFEAGLPAANQAHNVGGNAFVNLYAYALSMLNAGAAAQAFGASPPATPEARWILFACCAAFVAVAGVVIVRRVPGRLARWWFWALFSFALAIAIPSRTAFSSAFYLLVPGLYLAIFLFVTVFALLRAFGSARSSRITASAAVAVLALHLIGFVQTAPPYLHPTVMSDNFEAALDRVRAQLERTPAPSAIVFLWPQTEYLGYRFVGPPHDPALAEFLLPRGASDDARRALNAVISDRSYAGDAPAVAPAPGTITVVLGNDMRLVRIVPPAS